MIWIIFGILFFLSVSQAAVNATGLSDGGAILLCAAWCGSVYYITRNCGGRRRGLMVLALPLLLLCAACDSGDSSHMDTRAQWSRECAATGQSSLSVEGGRMSAARCQWIYNNPPRFDCGTPR
jgi:hypothetical protein